MSGVRLQDGLLRVVTPPAGRDGTSAPLSPEQWLDAVITRHTHRFTATEFLKAVRALSARYVERRADLPARSPLDSPGKRAAFAGFFAPLHYLIARRTLDAIGAAHVPADRILDLGCGTGVAAAAWSAEAATTTPQLIGVDKASWALNEANWNWNALGLSHTTRRQSLVDAAGVGPPRRPAARDRTGIVLAWSVNEIIAADRARLLPRLIEAHDRGASVLVLEPLAKAAVPWWDEWAARFVDAGGRADEWKFAANLPARLAELDRSAGFRREHISARSLWLPGR